MISEKSLLYIYRYSTFKLIWGNRVGSYKIHISEKKSQIRWFLYCNEYIVSECVVKSINQLSLLNQGYVNPPQWQLQVITWKAVSTMRVTKSKNEIFEYNMSHFAYACKTEGQNGISRLISGLCVNCLISIPEYSRLNHLDVHLV